MVNPGYKKQRQVVAHDRNEIVKHKAHINGIENFWSMAKMRLAKFSQPQQKATIYPRLKECELRLHHLHPTLANCP